MLPVHIHGAAEYPELLVVVDAEAISALIQCVALPLFLPSRFFGCGLGVGVSEAAREHEISKLQQRLTGMPNIGGPGRSPAARLPVKRGSVCIAARASYVATCHSSQSILLSTFGGCSLGR